MSQEEIALNPCPFCGRPGAMCQLDDEPGSAASFWVNCSCGVETPERRTEAEAIAKWNTRALPAQGEPVASFNMATGERDNEETDSTYFHADAAAQVPQPVVARGAGEAIFAECAEIALEHVGAHSYCSHLVTKDRMAGYDEACRDIAEAIKLRASNRKTMDAIK